MTTDAVQSEFVGLQSAPEATLGTQATSGWRKDEPNPGGIADFYAALNRVARNPISPDMMRRKGAVVGLAAAPQITLDLTRDVVERYAVAWYRSLTKYPGGTGTGRWSKAEATVTAVTATGYTVTGGGALPNNVLVYASGFSNSANNGLKVTTGSVNLEVKAAGLVAEAAPPATAILYVVGVQGASGDITVNAGGNLTSTVLDFTTLGIQEGAFGWLGGGTAASPGNFGFTVAPQNRGFFRFKDVTANLITVDRRTQAWGADAGAGKTIQIFFGPWWRNVPGIHADYKEQSYSLELAFPGAGAADAVAYAYALGSCVGQVEITAGSEDKVVCTMSFVGTNLTSPSTSRATGANTPLEALGDDAFTTADQVRRLRVAKTVDETGVSSDIVDWTLTLNHNVSPQVQQGTLGAKRMVFGKADTGLSLTAIFVDTAVCDAIRANTSCAFDVALRSADCTLLFDTPSLDPMGGSPDIQENAIVTLPMTGEAWKDDTFGFVSALTMFPYLPAD